MSDPVTTADAAATADAATAADHGTAVHPALRIAAATSILAGAIHYAVVPEHRAEWWVYALFFTLLGLFEIVWAALAWQGPDRWVLYLGVVVNLAVLVLWTVTRTSGLPFGPDAHDPEAVGAADVICCVAEASTIAAVLWALIRSRSRTGLDEAGNGLGEPLATG